MISNVVKILNKMQVIHCLIGISTKWICKYVSRCMCGEVIDHHPTLKRRMHAFIGVLLTYMMLVKNRGLQLSLFSEVPKCSSGL